MNTTQLECFVTVAEHLNFSKASHVLKISQPAVSHQIRMLEEELDVKLFRRSSRSVLLTQEGFQFLPDAKRMLRTAYSAKERLSRREQFLMLEIGCHNYMELNLLPPVLKKLAGEFPLLHPSIHIVPFPSLFGLLDTHQVHAVVGAGDAQKKLSLCYREFARTPVVCICAPEHPLARHESLIRAQLTEEYNFIGCSPDHVSNSVFSIQSSVLSALPPEKRFLTESIESAIALAKAQIGYTLYPDFPLSREQGLCYVPVTDLPNVSFGVYYLPGNEDPALRRFVKLMVEEANDS